MVTHTSHYAVIGAVGSEVAGAALSVFCGAPVNASIVTNPATISLAVVAVIDVLGRRFAEIAKAKIEGSGFVADTPAA